jgi:hypothetical protein
LAAKLATSAGEHTPIDFVVPTSYEPKTGANSWAEVGIASRADSQAVRSQALPPPVDATCASEARASLVGRARADSLAEDPSACWLSMRPSSSESEGPHGEASLGAAAAMRATPPRPAPPPRPGDEVELASMPMPSMPTSGLAAAPAAAMDDPVADFISHRLLGLFSAPEASKRLEA